MLLGRRGDGKKSGCFYREFRFALGRGGGLLLFQFRGCFGPVFQQQFFLGGVMAVPGVVQHGNRSPAYGVDVGVVLNEQAGNLRFSLDAGSVVPGGRGRSGPLRWRRLPVPDTNWICFVSLGTGWQHPPTNRGAFADASPLRADGRPRESGKGVPHGTNDTFRISGFTLSQGIMCVNAPVTLSSSLNSLVISRLFNLLQPISTLFNYLCSVTLNRKSMYLSLNNGGGGVRNEEVFTERMRKIMKGSLFP